MKLVALAMLLAFSLAAGISGASEKTQAVKNDLKQTAKDTAALLRESRDHFEARMSKARDEGRERTEKLEKKVEQVDKNTRKVAERRLSDLRRAGRRFDRKLDKLKDAAEDKWEEMKDDVEEAAERLDEAADDLAEKVR